MALSPAWRSGLALVPRNGRRRRRTSSATPGNRLSTGGLQGGRVLKAIGFDAGPADMRRRNHAGNQEDPKYEFWYPLIEWGWDRERCKEEIRAAGLPVPPKSSCFFCPAMKPQEIEELPRHLLRRIVIMEA